MPIRGPELRATFQRPTVAAMRATTKRLRPEFDRLQGLTRAGTSGGGGTFPGSVGYYGRWGITTWENFHLG